MAPLFPEEGQSGESDEVSGGSELSEGEPSLVDSYRLSVEALDNR